MHPRRRHFVEMPTFSQQEPFYLVQPRVGTVAYIFTGVTLLREFSQQESLPCWAKSRTSAVLHIFTASVYWKCLLQVFTASVDCKCLLHVFSIKCLWVARGCTERGRRSFECGTWGYLTHDDFVATVWLRVRCDAVACYLHRPLLVYTFRGFWSIDSEAFGL